MTGTQDAVITLLHREILARDGQGRNKTYQHWSIRPHGRDLIVWCRAGNTERVISVGPRGRTVQLNSEDQAELSEMLCAIPKQTPLQLTSLLNALGLEKGRAKLSLPAGLV